MTESGAVSVCRAIGQNVPVVLLLVFLLGLGTALRAGRLDEFHPIDMDERTWFELGSSLLHTGVPTSWTIFTDVYIAAGGEANGVVVTPYLDHPPLFALFVSSWALLVESISDGPPAAGLLRLPMIAIALASMLLVWLYSGAIFGARHAAFSLVAIVFFPSHILTSRLVTPEHLIGLLLIGSLTLEFLSFRSVPRARTLLVVLIALACWAGPLLKLSGAVVPASVILLAAMERRWKLAVVWGLAATASFATLVAYASFYDWSLFLAVAGAHHTRAQSFAHFWSIFTSLDIGNYPLRDPSIIVGMIGVIVLIASRGFDRPARFLFAPFFSFAFLSLYVAPVEAYGWYKYTLYPLLAVGLGAVFVGLDRGEHGYWVLFLPLLNLMLENSGILVFPGSQRAFMIGSFVLVGLSVLSERHRVSRAVFALLLGMLIVFEVVWVADKLGYISQQFSAASVLGVR